MTAAFDLQANLIVLNATIEGEPKRFLIDTGASASVVGSDTARDLGLEERRRFLGRGAGGTWRSAWPGSTRSWWATRRSGT